MKKCLTCKKEFQPKTKANHVKYCSLSCRNHAYYIKRGGADAQREYYYSKNKDNGLPKIKCQICGRYYRQVGTHVVQTHHITAREYREEYGFDVKKGQLPEDLRELKEQRCRETGTINNLKGGKRYWFSKGDKKAGRYSRSAETLKRLKNLYKYNSLKKKSN